MNPTIASWEGATTQYIHGSGICCRVSSDIGSTIDLKQVCLHLFISGRFAQQSAEAHRKWGIFVETFPWFGREMVPCVNFNRQIYSQKDIHKELPTHIQEHRKSLWEQHKLLGTLRLLRGIPAASFACGEPSELLVLEECTCYFWDV